MDRRHFLTLSSAAAVATLSGCQFSPVTALPEATDWQLLKASFSGQLLFPSENGFSRFYKAANSRYDSIIPAVIARCATKADIQLVLAFARRYQLPITGRSGGHNYAGYSSTQGILLDLALMADIQLQPEDNTAWIGAGAKLGDVYDQLSKKGRSIPAGSCVGVGIAGLTQGGGFGIADRLYGLTCDAVLEAELVTVDGEVLRCSEQHNANLFWGLQGGGGGQFGIVTRFKFQTFATSDILSCRASFALKDALAVLSAWQDWSQQLPEQLWSQVALWWSGDTKRELVVQIRLTSLGLTEQAKQLWQNWLQLLKVEPLTQEVALHSYRDFMLSDCDGLEMSECKLSHQSEQAKLNRTAMTGSSDFFNQPINQAGLTALLEQVLKRHRQGFSGGILFTLMGGAIGSVAIDQTAFVHRDAVFCAQYMVSYPVGTDETSLKNAALWVNQMRTVMRPYSTGGAYLNYTDALLKNWPDAYYAGHYSKLQQLKGRYDPQWLLRFAQGITPA
ncbi:FAD-binding oxidoreductase [Rheinheimera sediminis]|uniref:FAD-binding oxidoreductase n=1 Tax=Rheinheimera sp. YQF-1 TaxID=2499626 RepID=UPI001647DBAA|nr:FAD-binding oxidoreductase [Rheinheimera sp. YQF-1]